MKNKQKKVILSLSLAAVLGLGGTLAYFSATTNTATNTFTMGDDIDGKTEEPNWKEENADKFKPGQVIAKDPQIVNESEEGSDPVYAGAKITYQIKDAAGEWVDTTYAELDKFINIKSGATYDDAGVQTAAPTTDGFNTAAWTMSGDNTQAVYNTTLAAGVTTAKIFDGVEIDVKALSKEQIESVTDNNDATVPQFDVSQYTTLDNEGKTVYTYTTYQMKDFQIVITGYLVQTEGFANANVALSTAFPNVFKF